MIRQFLRTGLDALQEQFGKARATAILTLTDLLVPAHSPASPLAPEDGREARDRVIVLLSIKAGLRAAEIALNSSWFMMQLQRSARADAFRCIRTCAERSWSFGARAMRVALSFGPAAAAPCARTAS